jgi:hypothetical protein
VLGRTLRLAKNRTLGPKQIGGTPLFAKLRIERSSIAGISMEWPDQRASLDGFVMPS